MVFGWAQQLTRESKLKMNEIFRGADTMRRTLFSVTANESPHENEERLRIAGYDVNREKVPPASAHATRSLTTLLVVSNASHNNNG